MPQVVQLGEVLERLIRLIPRCFQLERGQPGEACARQLRQWPIFTVHAMIQSELRRFINSFQAINAFNSNFQAL